MEKVIHPDHYQGCSKLGRDILLSLKCTDKFEGSPYNDTVFKDALELECIIVIRDYLQSDFFLGNCFKYLWRLGEKDKILGLFVNKKKVKDDLEKAFFYCNLFIKNHHRENPDIPLPDWIYELKMLLSNTIVSDRLRLIYSQTRNN